MKNYKTTATFTKELSVSARNAEEADLKFADLIADVEFRGDVSLEDYQMTEDEGVNCPQCDGDGVDTSGLSEPEDSSDDLPTCPRCDGEGVIYPDEYFDDPELYH